MSNLNFYSASAGKVSRVPRAYLGTATEMEVAIIDKLDIAEQVNDDIARKLAEVEMQTRATNDRVLKLEEKSVEVEALVSTAKRWRARAVAAAGLFFTAAGYAMDKLISRFLPLILCITLAGCVHRPIPAPQHLKPDAGPVQRPVAETRAAIAETRTAVHNASTSAAAGSVASASATQRAVNVAIAAADAARNGLAAKSAEAETLATQTEQLSSEVKGLQIKFAETETQLRVAEAAAAAAETRNAEVQNKLAEFDAKVAAQTEALNQREVELANERAAKAAAVEAQHKAETELRVLHWKIAGWAALALLILAGSFYFKLLRVGL